MVRTDLQIVESEHVVLLEEGERRLVLESAPLALHLLVRALQDTHRGATTLAALLAWRTAALRLAACTRVHARPHDSGGDARRSRPPPSAVRPPPSAVMRNTLSPMSIPLSMPVRGNGAMGTSAQEMPAYQPSASRELVSVLGVRGPSKGR
jgi:hypothetical protein